jgi:hypothetical protein
MAGIGWGTPTRGIARATWLIENLVEGASAHRRQTKTVLGTPNLISSPLRILENHLRRQEVCSAGKVFAADSSDLYKLFLVF